MSAICETTLLPATLTSADRSYILAAAASLYEEGALSVRLFGSLAHGKMPTVHSDFDFAVEGLPEERYLGCLGRLLQALPRPVDLVELERCPQLLKDRILEEGILLPR